MWVVLCYTGEFILWKLRKVGSIRCSQVICVLLAPLPKHPKSQLKPQKWGASAAKVIQWFTFLAPSCKSFDRLSQMESSAMHGSGGGRLAPGRACPVAPNSSPWKDLTFSSLANVLWGGSFWDNLGIQLRYGRWEMLSCIPPPTHLLSPSDWVACGGAESPNYAEGHLLHIFVFQTDNKKDLEEQGGLTRLGHPQL